MSECPINLKCVFDNFGFCVNTDYCQELADPLKLPYTIQFSHQHNCNKLIVDEYIWNLYEENTIKDLHECGWSPPSDIPYDYFFNYAGNYWFLRVYDHIIANFDCVDYGWHCSIALPYIHKFKNRYGFYPLYDIQECKSK